MDVGDIMTLRKYGREKIAIVGFASSSRTLAPFDDPSWDISTLNHAWTWIPRHDIWYEMHTPEHARAGQPDHWKWLTSQPAPGQPGFKPIYMQDHYPEIPASVKFPMEEVDAWLVKRFGSEGGYYTSSISEMLAHAMFSGYSEIGLYGIDLLNNDEWGYQRPGAEYLIGLARGAGIKVHVPKESALLKANYVYGFTDPPDQDMAKNRIAHAESIAKTVEADKFNTAPYFHTFDGSLQSFRLAKSLISKHNRLRPEFALEEIEKDLDLQIADMENKRTTQLASLKSAEGAENVARSFVSWLSHEARGGTLTAST